MDTTMIEHLDRIEALIAAARAREREAFKIEMVSRAVLALIILAIVVWKW